jgi:hypothetical protein
MMRRSMKGEIISERYGLVMLTYGDRVNDVYRGNTSIAEAVKRPLPEFQMQVRTNTALAFSEASKIIKKNLKFLGNSPSPIICHLTDGEYNDGGSPQQIVQEIRSIRNTDGPVLVENVFVGTDLTREPITDIRHWPGVLSPDSLTTDYLRDLYDMSSPLPASYAGEIRTFGYGLQPGAKMLIPAQSPELVELAFVMGSATKTK